MPTCEPVCWLEFQSTLSVRRATNPPKTLAENHIISIHALRKESDLHQRLSHQLLHISIHALRKESDISLLIWLPPRRISIHALRKESDVVVREHGELLGEHFNPRSP